MNLVHSYCRSLAGRRILAPHSEPEDAMNSDEDRTAYEALAAQKLPKLDDYVAMHARLRPRAVALIEHHRDLGRLRPGDLRLPAQK